MCACGGGMRNVSRRFQATSKQNNARRSLPQVVVQPPVEGKKFGIHPQPNHLMQEKQRESLIKKRQSAIHRMNSR